MADIQQQKQKLSDLKKIQKSIDDNSILNIPYLISTERKINITQLDIQKILNIKSYEVDKINKVAKIIKEYKKDNKITTFTIIIFKDIEHILKLYYDNENDKNRCISYVFEKLNKCIGEINFLSDQYKKSITPTKNDFDNSIKFLETNVKWQYNYLVKNHKNEKNMIDEYNALIKEITELKIKCNFDEEDRNKLIQIGGKFARLYIELNKKNISKDCKKNIAYSDSINKYARYNLNISIE